MNKQQLIGKLTQFKQQHLLDFFDGLSASDQNQLVQDIESIDFASVCKSFEKCDPRNAKPHESIDNLLMPLTPDVHQSITRTAPEVLAKFRDYGLKEIAEGKVAALLLAGGQGTRLGSSNPKGMYDVGLPSHKSLFQIQAERILRLQQLANPTKPAVIPWYIMTSGPTFQATADYFKQNNYFGLKPENVILFQQNTIPCFTFEGKIILDQKHQIARAPDGNGGLYSAIRSKRILDDMKKRGIVHINGYCVDNILAKVADPVFIGYSASKGVDCACKVVEKVLPNEAVGIICTVEGKYRVVEYSEVSHQTAQKRAADGRLAYNAGNICNHYFTLDFLTNLVKEDQMVYHVAKKKIPYITATGERVKPEKPNGIKLEKFIFDVLEFSRKFAVWEVLREDEFSPLKNNDECDKDTPTTSRLSLFNLHQRYVLNAGGKFIDDNGSPLPLIPSHVENQVICEISPLTSYDGEQLEPLVSGKTFHSPLIL